MNSSIPRPKATLTVEQMRAIHEFRAKHGREWKNTLSQMWFAGKDVSAENGHLLRQIRNAFGPAWLASFVPQGFNLVKLFTANTGDFDARRPERHHSIGFFATEEEALSEVKRRNGEQSWGPVHYVEGPMEWLTESSPQEDETPASGPAI